MEKQVAVVTALMRVSPDRPTFMRHFNRSFRPHLPEQRDLFEDFGPLPEITKEPPTEAASKLLPVGSRLMLLTLVHVVSARAVLMGTLI